MIAVPEVIDKFQQQYFFLSNFYDAKVKVFGLTFKNNEAAFQSQKCPERAHEFCRLDSSSAKKLGRSVQLRSDWEDVKEQVMYDCCKAKFMQNKDLKRKLINTGHAELIEGNTWKDKVWGVYKGHGENKLGKILMQIRSELH